MAMTPPLPVKDGINPTRLHLPVTANQLAELAEQYRPTPPRTIAEYMMARFDHVDPATLRERFDSGEVVTITGDPVGWEQPLGSHEFIWYYRTVPDEQPLPESVQVLFEDEHLLVVDKPHFMPTTPGGRFVKESALVKLRVATGHSDLVPLHRLDRATAGVLLFSTNPATRGAYQMLFEQRRVTKTYQAIVRLDEDPDRAIQQCRRLPLVYRNRIIKTRGVITVDVQDYPVADSGRLAPPRIGKRRRSHDPTTGPNAQTRISWLGARDAQGPVPHHGLGWVRLEPRTGRTHQLRVHLAQLGTPILHDRLYPELLVQAPDEMDRPLQLLASTLEFIDPLSGQARRFQTDRRLAYQPR